MNKASSMLFASAGRRFFATASVLGLSAILFAPVAGATALTTAQMNGLNLGTDVTGSNLPNVTTPGIVFIDLGATNLGWNAYQLDGNVLFGQGLTVAQSGGNNGGIGAGYNAYTDNTTHISGSLDNPVTYMSASTMLTSAAATIANNVSSFANTASNFTPGEVQTFANLNSTSTISGSTGLNVINIGTNAGNGGTGGSADCGVGALTISGPATAYFVINANCDINTNQVMTLSGGVTAANILWNLTGSGKVLQTAGGDSLVGTFLATDGGQFQFSELQLNGELINTDGNVQLVSGNHTLTANGFTVPMSPTPEPASFSLMLGAGLLVAGIARKRTRSL